MKRRAAFGAILALLATAAATAAAIEHDADVWNLLSYFRNCCETPERLQHRKFSRLASSRPSHYGFIDRHGKQVIPARYDGASSFHQGLCAVRINDKCGYIDKRGNLVIPARFSTAGDFADDLAMVRTSWICGYIDRTGQYAIQPSNWMEASDFRNGIAEIVAGNKHGLINKRGDYLVKPEFDEIRGPSEDIFRTAQDGRVGFVAIDGRVVAKPEFKDASDFSEGFAAVRVDDKWGYIDRTGKTVIQPSFQYGGQFHNGLAVVEQGDRFGLIDKTANFVINPTYRYMAAIVSNSASQPPSFQSDGLIPVAFHGRWGFVRIDTGKMAIKALYADVETFSEGLASVGIYDRPERVPTSRHNGCPRRKFRRIG